MLLIQTQNLHFKYEKSINKIIENISFNINSSDKIGLIGKNGCGKTTLLQLILANLLPNSGLIYKKENIKIGYLQQEINNSGDLSLEEFLWKDSNLASLKAKLKKFEENEIYLE